MKLLKQGAEAKIYLDKGNIIKERIVKSYRISAIDQKLRKLRIRREAKLLQKVGNISPRVLDVDEKEMKIVMEYIKGELLKDVLEELEKKQLKNILTQLGKEIATLHDKNIIHGDLTTSNIIIKEEKPYLIDFGLGHVSLKVEDKAVDLHLLRQALASKHHEKEQEAFAYLLEGYKDCKEYEEVLKRLQKVEGRGRYKQK